MPPRIRSDNLENISKDLNRPCEEVCLRQSHCQCSSGHLTPDMITRALSSASKKQSNFRPVCFHLHSLCFSQPLWGCSTLNQSRLTILRTRVLLMTFLWALVQEPGHFPVGSAIGFWIKNLDRLATPLLLRTRSVVSLLAAEVNSWGLCSPTLASFLSNHFSGWFCSNPYDCTGKCNL